MTKTVTCRKCGEDQMWDSNLDGYKACRNGCSEFTAAIADGTELVHTRGSTEEGALVSGNAIVRKPTCHD